MTEPLTPEERRLGKRLAAHLDALPLDDPAVVVEQIVASAVTPRSRRGPARVVLLAAALVAIISGGVIAGGGPISRLFADTVVLPPDPTLPPPPPASLEPTGPPPSEPMPIPSDGPRLVNGDVLISYGGHVYRADPTGGREPAELAGPRGADWGAQWSPDASRLLVLNGTVDGEVDLNLFLVSPDGRSVRQLTGTADVPLRHAQDPAWSPDGTRIALRATRAGQAGIFVISVDPAAVDAAVLGKDLGAPAWAPDGNRIVVRNGEGRLAVMTPGSPDIVPIVTTATVSDPIWAPDDSIVFTEFIGAGRSDFHGAIFRVRADGTELTQVTDPGSGRLDVDLDATRDGRLLGFTRQDQDGTPSPAVCCGTVVRSIVDGTERLVPLGGGAVFSPDGRWMVATGPAPGDSQSLKVAWIAASVDGGERRVLLVRSNYSGVSTADNLSWGVAGG